MITVNQPRENGRTTFCRQFTYNPKGEYNSRRDGAIVSGVPVAGILVSDLEDGTLISIPENGSPVLFYKAKSDYESDLNGAGRQLMVRKDCYDTRAWNNSNINAFSQSTILSWLNGAYKGLFSEAVQTMMGTTVFPYTPGNGTYTVDTLSESVFLLSVTELGKSSSSANVEGTALPIANELKIAYLNGGAVTQWTRTPMNNYNGSAYRLSTNGTPSAVPCSSATEASRPCFTLPATAMVDPTPNSDGSYNLIY